MAQVMMQGAKTAAQIFSVWIVMLGVLAALPGKSIGGGQYMDAELPNATVFFEHSRTNTTIQDVDGTVSVQVRGLRPVVVERALPEPM